MSHSLRSTVLSGLFAALVAVSAVTAVPTPWGVPLTLQVFSLALTGFLFSPFLACKILGIYLLCGAAGLPVFASMQGGIAVLLGPTGGYLWGFFPLVLACALPLSSRVLRLLCAAVGLLLCHTFGAAQASLIGNTSLHVILPLSLPLLVKDLLLVTAAWTLSRPCKRALCRFSLLPTQKKDECL